MRRGPAYSPKAWVGARSKHTELQNILERALTPVLMMKIKCAFSRCVSISLLCYYRVSNDRLLPRSFRDAAKSLRKIHFPALKVLKGTRPKMAFGLGNNTLVLFMASEKQQLSSALQILLRNMNGLVCDVCDNKVVIYYY